MERKAVVSQLILFMPYITKSSVICEFSNGKQFPGYRHSFCNMHYGIIQYNTDTYMYTPIAYTGKLMWVPFDGNDPILY